MLIPRNPSKCHAPLTLFFAPDLIGAFMARVHFRNDETAVDTLDKSAVS
jgi:hypothetical protein